MKLKDRVAVVTGAAGGLGKVFSLALLQEGATTVMTDYTTEPFTGIGDELKPFKGQVSFKQLDVTNCEQVRQVMSEVGEEYGRLDILVNVAGGSLFTPKSLDEIMEDHWHTVIDVNLKGTFFCCKEAVPLMKRNKYGRIINLSSIGGRTASIVTGVPYAAAKGGILALTRRLALEVGPWGINVNAIAPGTVLSGRRMIDLWDELNPGEKEEILSSIPLKRLSTAEEQASVVVFLASEDASYITGTVIDVNGGRFMA